MSGPTLKELLALDVATVREDLESFALSTTEGCILDDPESETMERGDWRIRAIDQRLPAQIKRAKKRGEAL